MIKLKDADMLSQMLSLSYSNVGGSVQETKQGVKHSERKRERIDHVITSSPSFFSPIKQLDNESIFLFIVLSYQC